MAIYPDRSGQVDSNLRARDGRFIIQFVADDVNANAELVDQAVVEYVSFGDAAEAAVQRNIQGEVEVVGAGLAAGLDPERIRSKGLKGIGIRPEEALGQAVLAATEFAVPVQGELVIGKLTGIGQHERTVVERGAAGRLGEARRAGDAGK